MNQLTDVMAEFAGKSPDEIAQTMARRKIRGRMGTTYNCPMALLLKGAGSGAYVIGRKYIVRRSGKVIEKARTPENVADFIRKFDIGGYPSLIAPPPRCVSPKTSRSSTKGASGPSGAKRRHEIKNHLSKLVNRFGK